MPSPGLDFVLLIYRYQMLSIHTMTQVRLTFVYFMFSKCISESTERQKFIVQMSALHL